MAVSKCHVLESVVKFHSKMMYTACVIVIPDGVWWCCVGDVYEYGNVMYGYGVCGMSEAMK